MIGKLRARAARRKALEARHPPPETPAPSGDALATGPAADRVAPPDDAAAARGWVTAGLIAGLAALGALWLLVLVTVPMAPAQQAVLGAVTVAAFLIANAWSDRRVTLCLVVLSLAVSLRYLVWRLTDTLAFDGVVGWALGLGLLLAEAYAVLMLALGYAQTVWPRHRPVRALPPDPAVWPSVDVFIPTLNEPLEVVRPTVLAALALDWPPDRLRVHLLDDGGREAFARFARQVGCAHVTRPDRRHAKAGNLNHAMAVTDGAFIAVLDCDHVPTRAFLQLTLGWLVADPGLAVVQTPQHCHSPDPFQRNLAAGERVPPEGNLFHGLIQDGNDTWNAALFTGTGAVLRRAALEEIGGFAVATVTEDAHTTLRLHRHGWGTAYVGLPLTAGLAPERLARHLAQRARWTRGMVQILRRDNPLFGPGLTPMQRLCHLQATGHFLFPLPRLVFLTAPLAFLLLGRTVIAASPLAVAAYALPHFVHAVGTNSRLHRNWRHSFWSEVHETVSALWLAPVVVATLLRPGRGRFVVTAKGGRLDRGFLDLRAVYPNLILTVLLLAGLARGGVALLAADLPPLAFQAVVLNLVWAGLSLLTVLTALAVGREARRAPGRPPDPATGAAPAGPPLALRLPDGRVIAATALALSREGGRVALPGDVATQDVTIAPGAEIAAVFQVAARSLVIPAHVRRADAAELRLVWEPRTLAEESDLIQAVFGRADSWSGWSQYPPDRPWLSLARVVMSIGGLFRGGGRARPPARGGAGALTGTLLALLLLLAGTAAAQTTPRGTTVRPVPQAADGLPNVEIPAPPRVPTTAGSLPDLPVPPVPPPEGEMAPRGADVAPPAATGQAPDQPAPDQPAAAQPAAATTPATPAPPPRDAIRHVVLNLRQLGAPGALALRGTSDTREVDFGVRADEVVTAAQLSLSGAMSPALLPDASNITVTLNEQFVGTIPVNRDQPSFTTELPINPVFFQDANRLVFRFAGHYAPDCNDPLSKLLWATVYDASTLTLTLQRLPPQRDLARLPLPLFDPAVRQRLVLPVVLPASPGNDTLRAASIVASWFGAQAGFRGAGFPVAASPPEQGSAVVILAGGDGGAAPDLPGLPPLDGPTLALIPNPRDPLGTLLVVAGRDGGEAVAAATALAAGSRALSGAVAAVQAPALAPRAPYDAPGWIATNRPVRLGELVDAAALQTDGYTGTVHVPFRTAPDFITWRDAAFPLDLRYRAPPGPIVDVAASRLDVGLNGVYLDSVPLATDTEATWSSWLGGLFGAGDEAGGDAGTARVGLPTYDVFGFNELQFYFDARPLRRGECAAVPADLQMAIDPDSTIDLSSGIRFAELPNLAFFLNSGFPFTRMADLSRTSVVMPDRPSATEIGVLLDLMGQMGASTGVAATGVAVTRPDAVSALADRDLLVIGTLGRLGSAERLLAGAPLRIEGAGGVALALPTPLDAIRHVFGDPREADRRRVAAVLTAGVAPGMAMLVGGESPITAGRSVVALLGADADSLAQAMRTLSDPAQAPLVQGDLALLSGGQVSSYRVGARYGVGHLPFWMWPSWALGDQPVGLAAWLLGGAALFGLVLFRAFRGRGRVLRRHDAGPGGPPA